MKAPYWRLSGFYFGYFAALGAFVPYWSLFLKENGFDSDEIGQLSALLVGAKIVAPNLWGWIADTTGKNLRIIRWTSFLSALLFIGFLQIHNFISFAYLTLGFSFFWNAPLPLYEASTLAHLKDNSHRYSRIRLWGSIGFIIAVMGVGSWLDWQPIMLLPIVISSLLGFTWLTALISPESQRETHAVVSVGIVSIIKRTEVLAFLVVFILIQFAHAPYYVFYTLYLKEHLYTTTTTGLLWSLGVVSEIVLFLLMKRLLHRYSLRAILLTSLVFAMLRWILIGNFVDNVYLIVLAQLFHAATFGAAHITAIHFVQRFFDHQHQSKGQALYHSLSFGLGGMLGSLGSGHYWELLGSHVIFNIATLSCGLAYIVTYIWVGRHDNLLNLTIINE